MVENWGEPPERFTLTDSDEFDFLVSLSHSREMKSTPKEKNIAVTMEPSWSPNSPKSLPSHCKYVITSDKNIKGKNVFHEYTFMLHHDSRNNHETGYTKGRSREEYLTNLHLRNDIDSKSYPKKLSMFIANHGTLSGSSTHPDSLYSARENLLLKILKSDLDIDIYGIGWNIQDSRYKGSANMKSDGLSDYKYSICMENSREDLYLSEKFIDVFLNNCVPIYWGCKNVADAYPSDSFIELDPSMEDPISFLKEQVDKPISFRNDALQEAKRLYFDKYNLFNYLNDLL